MQWPQPRVHIRMHSSIRQWDRGLLQGSSRTMTIRQVSVFLYSFALCLGDVGVLTRGLLTSDN